MTYGWMEDPQNSEIQGVATQPGESPESLVTDLLALAQALGPRDTSIAAPVAQPEQRAGTEA